MEVFESSSSEGSQWTLIKIGPLLSWVPGSFVDCKPCIKFNPMKPSACNKSGDNPFTHDLERPKHRGQRGKHALQRRQYLDSLKNSANAMCDAKGQLLSVLQRYTWISDYVHNLVPGTGKDDERKKLEQHAMHGLKRGLDEDTVKNDLGRLAGSCQGGESNMQDSRGSSVPMAPKMQNRGLLGMVAILIGIQAYQHPSFPKLSTPHNDMDWLEQTLKPHLNGEFDDIYRVEDCTENTWMETITGENWMERLKGRPSPPKKVMVWWAGHSQQWGSSNTLPCKDSDPAQRGSTPTVNSMLRAIGKATSDETRVVFVLDACRTIVKDLPPDDDEMPRRGQHWVIYSCAAGKHAMEGCLHKKHSDFLTEFIPWLKCQFEDPDLGKLEISSDTFGYLCRAVLTRTLEYQKPEFLQSASVLWNDEDSARD
eukprot:TRINITY_DN63044_c0_g1_i1.p1 TRINITY_DN63044_c0_g1~~TRINITY_DN63044_c0_g1_i1.p1  ORF type:complete len:450 (-),score=64.52 TRINITY_DN63044_c0_g1_i1:171-1442(-)